MRGLDSGLVNSLGKGLLTNNNEVDNTRFDKFRSSFNAFEEGTSGLDVTKLDDKAKISKAVDSFLDGITDQTAKDKIRNAFNEAIKKGDTSGFTKQIKGLENYVNDLTVHSIIRTGGKMPNGINFAATYGFNYDDLMRGFTKAVEQNLIGKQPSAVLAMSKFFNEKTGAVGAMDAARGFYGRDIGVSEMMNRVSQDIGMSAVDLNKASSSAHVDNYYRSIKAVANELNMDPNALHEMITQGQTYTANTPGLQYFGGLEVGKVAEQAAVQTAVQAMTYDNTSIRRLGGTRGMMQNYMNGTLQNASESITQQLAALYTYAGQAGNTQVQERIKRYMTSPALAGGIDHQQLGLNQFITNMSKQLGANPYDVGYYIRNNSVASSEGLSALINGDPNFDVGKVAKLSKAEGFINAMRRNDPTARGQARVNAFLRSYAENPDEGVNMTSRLLNAGLNNPLLVAQAQEMDASGVSSVFFEANNPLYRKREETVRRQIEKHKILEANLAKHYAFINAPTTTAIMDTIFNRNAEWDLANRD